MKLDQIERRFEPSRDGKCAEARGGMVATAFPAATQAGVEMLERGGNAIDAGCAAAFALSVCEPQASGIGGQSMGIVHVHGRTFGIDGSSRVPSLAHLDRIADPNETLVGHRAATVPSTPAVLEYLVHRYGKLPTRVVLEPAIRLAREGYDITPLQRSLQQREYESLLQSPGTSGARYFLRRDDAAASADGAGEPQRYRAFEVGETFRQPELAEMLECMARDGVKSFYVGDIAQAIDADMRAHDGFLRAEDLAHIPWPIERDTIARRYRSVVVHTLPPPAAGPTLLLVLMMLGYLPARFIRGGSPAAWHFLAETFRKAFRQRRRVPTGPEYFAQLPNERQFIRRAFAKELASSIRAAIDADLPWIEPPSHDQDTTHLSAMAADGSCLGITQSIERVYGAKVAAAGLGFLYNNYMSRLETTDPAHPYYLRPNAVPWTTVAPAIVAHKKEPWLVVGSPGSERIFSTVSLFLMHLIDGDRTMREAMEAPRLHAAPGGTVSLEADRFDPAVVEHLERVGYRIERREPFAFYHGAIHATMRCRTKPGVFQGVAEIRRDGTAAGPVRVGPADPTDESGPTGSPSSAAGPETHRPRTAAREP